jgi:hypothetical protein
MNRITGLSWKTLQMVPASVDKVVFSTTDFDVVGGGMFRLHPKAYRISDGPPEEQFPLFVNTDGEPFYGKMAEYNENPRFGVAIKTDRVGPSIGLPRLHVSFNPNKFAHPFEGTTDTAQMRAQISSVEADLLEMGIRLDYGDASICRFDLMRQADFEFPYSDHVPILKTFTGRRVKSGTNDTSYTLENTQRETQWYDKGIEQNLENRPNLMRCEARALKSESVERLFGIRTISDLLKTDIETLNGRYKHHLETNVFPRHVDAKPIADSPTQIEFADRMLEYFMATHGNSGVSHWIRTSDAISIVETYGSISAWADRLHTVHGLSRQNAHAWKRKMETAYAHHRAFMDRIASKSARLYDNLYSFAI